MRFITLLACAGLSACTAGVSGTTPVETGQEFLLAERAAAQVRGVTIRFDEVIEDSRCPMNARCVWEGNARVAFTLRHAGKTASLTLNTSERFETRKEFGDIALRLVRLEPTPMAGEKVKEYTVVLVAEARP